MAHDNFLFGSENQAKAFVFVNERFQRTGACTHAPELAAYLKVKDYGATKMLRRLEVERGLLERRWKGCYQPRMPLPNRVREFLGMMTDPRLSDESPKRDGSGQ
jgi:hypothetical protein